MGFDGFGLDVRILKGVIQAGLSSPTLVQAKTIPIALEGRDVLVRARTGSGKTAAYALPLLQKVLRTKDAGEGGGVLALVLVPTKELCEQVKGVFHQLCKYCAGEITTTTAAGNKGDRKVPVSQIQKADVLIGTPSRLAALLESGSLNLKNSLQVLVVDEADLVLSFGYEANLRTIVESLPSICQSMLMSATLSKDIQALRKLILRKPVTVDAQANEGKNAEDRLQQFWVAVSEDDKLLLLFALLKLKVVRGKTLIFVNSIERCFRVKLFLEQFSIRAAVLNSELPQNSRLHILQQFNRGVFDILLATDESDDVIDEDSGEEADATGTGGNDDVAQHDETGGDSDNGSEGSGGSSAGEKEVASDDDDDDGDGDEGENSGDDDEDDGGDDDGGDGDEDDGDDGKGGSGDDNSGVDGKKEEKNTGKKKNQKQSSRKDEEYGVIRGVDFKGIQFVVNFDYPRSTKSYTHRIGRTARGGASGTALSMVAEDEMELLTKTEVAQRKAKGLPVPDHVITYEETTESQDQKDMVVKRLTLRKDLVERFRYRVEDCSRAVTKAAVREARLKDVKLELLNSEKLAAHFEDNPRELQLLKHDRVLNPQRVKSYMKNIPSYLLPQSNTHVAQNVAPVRVPLAFNKKRRRHRDPSAGAGPNKRGRKGSKSSDPLRTFSYQSSKSGGGGGGRSKSRGKRRK